MKKMLMKCLFCLLILCYSNFFKQYVHAEERGITFTLDAKNFLNKEVLTDQNRSTFSHTIGEGEITLLASETISFLYIEFDRIPESYTMIELKSGKEVQCGQEQFLHQCIDVESKFGEKTKEIQLLFPLETVISDIYVFTERKLPDWVQVWEPPCEQADLLLVSSHADDEQLFFAGILPIYSGEKKHKVQVVYTVQHFEANGNYDHQRSHEQLDGLWKVGVKNYPLISSFPDLYAESKDEETAFLNTLQAYQSIGITYEDILGYFVECIRRCKPLVIVSHDLKGEYGHGTHVVTARALTEAIEKAAVEKEYEGSYLKFGAWQVEKLYLHLYEEGQITLDLDIPLEHFNGKTAFQVSQDGFQAHKSQHWTWFYKWIYGTTEKPITKASQIKKYSPCNYGLYFSNVGPDKNKNDFMENIDTYLVRELEEYKKSKIFRKSKPELQYEEIR